MKKDDFDFNIKEDEGIDAGVIESIKEDKKPAVTGLVSKYSPSMMELESISQIKDQISRYGIKVASYTNELADLWNLYGCLNEYWARIHDIFGSVILKEVKDMFKAIRAKLLLANTNESIDATCYEELLDLRDKIYMVAQRNKLGLEVEKGARSQYERAKRGIIE